MITDIVNDPQLLGIAAEMNRQIELWGEQNHPDGTGDNFVGARDMAKDACDAAFDEGNGTWLDILVEEVFEAAAEEDEDKLAVELEQVAAVAVSWVKAIRRRQLARLNNAAEPVAV